MTPCGLWYKRTNTSQLPQYFLVGIFSSIASSFAENGHIKDAENLLAVCRSYGPRELGELQASTKLAIAFMALDEEVECKNNLKLALDLMESSREITKQEIGILSLYSIQLIRQKEQAYKSTSPVNKRIAPGLLVWIISIRALISIQMLPRARELWGLIGKGDELFAYELLDQIENQLAGHPLSTSIQRVKYLSTPDIFVPR